jgi:hypothetical protein
MPATKQQRLTLTDVIAKPAGSAHYGTTSINHGEKDDDERFWGWHGVWRWHRYVVDPRFGGLGHRWAD